MNSFSSDIELIRSLHDGHQAAYNVIYNRFARQLGYFVQSITGDIESAEDVVSESFVKVFNRKTDFATVEELKYFLFRTGSNGALDKVKMNKRYQNHIGQWAQTRETWSDDDVQKKYIESEAISLIYKELQQLPPQVKEVIRLSLFESLTLEEIAGKLNIAVKTVKNHKTKGLAIMREALLRNGDMLPAVMALNIVLSVYLVDL
ncbi:MAG: sigma-70 family RNA polymerase sigma factor [Chitinophagaceae bacterium]|nr:sigma-70 family RNA polymerase sigma factor [Chitinophagaceae bacterium]